MWSNQDAYIAEKLGEFDVQRAERRHRVAVDVSPTVRGRRPLGAIVRVAGRGMRRAGEALERWASPACGTEYRRGAGRL